jgi:tyrosyl-tRNA synthetase
VETYLKIFTDLNKEQIQELLEQHQQNPGARIAQKKLAEEVTSWVHGPQNCKIAINVTQYLTGEKSLNDVDSESLEVLKAEIPVVSTSSVVDALTEAGLASSNTEARRLIAGNAVSINGQKSTKEQFEDSDFSSNRLLIRKGKAYKDSALVEKS